MVMVMGLGIVGSEDFAAKREGIGKEQSGPL